MTVPLPTNILAEDIREIIREAECAALVVSLREVPALAPIVGACHTVRSVIIMDRCRAALAVPCTYAKYPSQQSSTAAALPTIDPSCFLACTM